MRLPRSVHHVLATVGGYFWLPCPNCGRAFGGHEWREDPDGHEIAVPTVDGNGRGVCPRCAAAGVGCVAWAAATPRRVHVGCVYLDSTHSIDR